MSMENRFRGVRKRQWGSWVSEIGHPVLRTRIWLGTFKTAEEAARAYDEASRMINGPAARTNFPDNGSSESVLTSKVRGKLLDMCRTASSTVNHQDKEANASETTDTDGDREDYIEDMIRELTYNGPIEVRSLSAASTSSTYNH